MEAARSFDARSSLGPADRARRVEDRETLQNIVDLVDARRQLDDRACSRFASVRELSQPRGRKDHAFQGHFRCLGYQGKAGQHGRRNDLFHESPPKKIEYKLSR